VEKNDMAKSATEVLKPQDRTLEWGRQAAIVVAASLFVALCARFTAFLAPTPVPLTLQNFGVLLVGLTLGRRRGFAALLVYLAEGAVGLPVFNPLGPGGIAQLLGPTGGYLLAYPFVAWTAGWAMERGAKTLVRALMAGFLAEVVLFTGGLSWLYVYTHSLAKAAQYGLYWFVFAEVFKVAAAASLARGWQRLRAVRD
jgi:biotin transport system substrate-specific component